MIARRVSEKLRDCYANKLFRMTLEDRASQGILLEEEKSKPAKKKKNKKKKNKSTKTSAASSMLTTPFFANGIDLPQGSLGQPFSLENEDPTDPANMLAVSNELASFSLQTAKTLIQNAASNAHEFRNIQEKQHSIDELKIIAVPASEENTQWTPQKKNKKKKKKAANSATEQNLQNKENVIGSELQKKEAQPNEADPELKSTVSQAGESVHTFDLSIFDEKDKKVSRNKKKKMKKKLKKEKLKKGQNVEETNQADFISYLIDTKILRDISFQEKLEGIESAGDPLWDTTTTDGASVRTLLGTICEFGSQHKGKLSCSVSHSVTPVEISDSEDKEKSLSQYSSVYTETPCSEEKLKDEEEKKEPPSFDSGRLSHNHGKTEEKKKERFKLVPAKSYRSGGSSNIQAPSSSLNSSSYLHRSQQSNNQKPYDKMTNAQLVDYDLTGFTEVRGKKKKTQPVIQQNPPSLLSKIDQQKNYFSKYHYEEKKPKPPHSNVRGSQQSMSKVYDYKEKPPNVKSDTSAKEKTSPILLQKAKSENHSHDEVLKDLHSQTPGDVRSRQNSSVKDPKSDLELMKTDSKKTHKPLKLNPSAPPIKISQELEAQQKLAMNKVVNYLYEERVEKDIESYVEKLNYESNVLEDFRRVTFNRLKHIIVGTLPGKHYPSSSA